MHLKELKWNIAEQEKMVKCGKKYFETDYLKFYFNLDDCIEEQNPDLILLSGVIQYIEKPYDLLSRIKLQTPVWRCNGSPEGSSSFFACIQKMLPATAGGVSL